MHYLQHSQLPIQDVVTTTPGCLSAFTVCVMVTLQGAIACMDFCWLMLCGSKASAVLVLLLCVGWGVTRAVPAPLASFCCTERGLPRRQSSGRAGWGTSNQCVERVVRA